MKIKNGIYFITDSEGFSEEEFLWRVEEGLKGGAVMLQLREKNKTTREYIELGKKVLAVAKKYKVPLIIDDRVDVALAINADGVHVGREDMPVYLARKLMGDKKIIGATAKTVEQAVLAEKEGADYLGVGAIFKTTTKVKTVLTSIETLREIKKAVSAKVFAIGGLNKGNIDILSDTGIDGICAVGAIMKAENPKAALSELAQKAREIGII